MDILLEPMFRLPFLTGLLLALSLPQLGLLLRLRHEWLAALGFAHLAGAGGALGAMLGLAVLPAALGLAVAGVLARALVAGRGNDFHAMMILAGWSVMIIVMAVSQHAHGLERLLVDGQLYFTHRGHLVAAGLLFAGLLLALPSLMPHVLRAELFPGQFPDGPRALAFQLLVAAGVALAAMVTGVMTAFALLFVPAWAAWRLAGSWRAARWLASGLALFCYLLAFIGALLLDMPFGPMLVMTLVLVALPAGLLGGRFHHPSGSGS